MSVELKDIIRHLDDNLKEGEDIPQYLWIFFSRWTPIVNVDLIIRNELNQCLLTWRDDEFENYGWHVPGGVVRYREKWLDRVLKVAESELGIKNIQVNPVPLGVYEVFVKPKTRGHFISIPFECFIESSSTLTAGQWFDTCPNNIIECQKIYGSLINNANNKM